MEIGGYFQRLGARLEREWGDCDRDEEAFPVIAARAVADLPPSEHLDREALVRFLLDPDRPAERPLAPLGAFGQPGYTAHYGRGFVVDVYFWTHSLSAIHDHPFCGIFTILEGFSVHARYGFEPAESLGARVRLGRIELESIEVLGKGHVEPFSLRSHPLIHVLLHVPVPSISLVVRTIRTEGYFRYFPPTVALAMDEPDELIGRSLMLLDTLRTGGDPAWAQRFTAFLDRADYETTFRALSRIWGYADEEERAGWLRTARKRHGARADLIPPALSRAVHAAQVDGIRMQLTGTDDRFVATALMVAEQRDEVVRILGERHDEPEAELKRFLEEVCPEGEEYLR